MKANAFMPYPIKLNLLTWDAEHGTGTTSCAWLAPMDGSSMLIRFALQFQTNVKIMLKMGIALSASKVTTFRKESVCSLSLTMLSPQNSVVLAGTGTTRSA